MVLACSSLFRTLAWLCRKNCGCFAPAVKVQLKQCDYFYLVRSPASERFLCKNTHSHIHTDLIITSPHQTVFNTPRNPFLFCRWKGVMVFWCYIEGEGPQTMHLDQVFVQPLNKLRVLINPLTDITLQKIKINKWINSTWSFYSSLIVLPMETTFLLLQCLLMWSPLTITDFFIFYFLISQRKKKYSAALALISVTH